MFTKQFLSPDHTGLFDPLLLDYLSGSPTLQPFYTYPFNREGFKSILSQQPFAGLNREVLTDELKRQAQSVGNTHPATLANIGLLSDTTTYTVTTGHQLCLFTGPLYFVYKIISAINLCESLKEAFPGRHFVPVYWMASEDHDFEEVNHAHVFGKTITWHTPQTGSVGEFSTQDIQPALDEIRQVLGSMTYAGELMDVFEKAYSGHSNLADATRFLVNELFGQYGLVTLDGNSKPLKALFGAELAKDIFGQTAFTQVTATCSELEKHYKVQVNPREINLFYKDAQRRERLVKEGDLFRVLNTDLLFSAEEIKAMIEHQPERLSPNVVTRPLYQQKILPNVAYVGGPGELAYWMEYKNMFSNFGVQFPVLVPRQFVTVIDQGTATRWHKLNLEQADLFRDTEDLVKAYAKRENGELHLDDARQQVETMYQQLLGQVLQVDKTLQGSVEAEKQKTLNGLSIVEQKLNRALRQRSETDVNQIRSVRAKLFPGNTPQERYDNMSMYYARYGRSFIEALKTNLVYDLSKFHYTILQEA